MPLKDFTINLRPFKKFDPSQLEGIGYRAYIDEKLGLLLNTYKGELLEQVYIASREDQSLCPRFYENARSFVSVPFRHGPPTIMLSCPSSVIVPASRVSFLVYTPEHYDSVKWILSEGTIVSGQGTREIEVDTTGLGGRKITVTVELTIENDPRVYSSSCAIQISEKRNGRTLSPISDWNEVVVTRKGVSGHRARFVNRKWLGK
jgi:hypothetical protein